MKTSVLTVSGQDDDSNYKQQTQDQCTQKVSFFLDSRTLSVSCCRGKVHRARFHRACWQKLLSFSSFTSVYPNRQEQRPSMLDVTPQSQPTTGNNPKKQLSHMRMCVSQELLTHESEPLVPAVHCLCNKRSYKVCLIDINQLTTVKQDWHLACDSFTNSCLCFTSHSTVV